MGRGFWVLGEMNFTPIFLTIWWVFFAGGGSGVGVLVAGDGSGDQRVLLEFKKGIEVDPLGKVRNSWNRSGADQEKCPAGWYGVVCDESGSSVVAIVLDRLQLGGELKFNTLVGLKMLKNLSLAGNLFTGRLVPVMGTMSSLQVLDLSGNRFYGPIPARISHLWNLNYLNLSNNNLKGGFPDGFRNLQQLRTLDLHSNEIFGDIGTLLPELRNVEYVDLSHNRFYGGISAGKEKVSSLANTVHYVNFSYNNLSGGFFDDESIVLFRSLQILDLGDNQISGELPSFGSLPNLQVLNLRNNQLFGSIPEELLESSMPLTELDLSGNGFTGKLLTALDRVI